MTESGNDPEFPTEATAPPSRRRTIIHGIFDMQFTALITTKMMPAVYALIMALAVLLCVFLTVDAFLTSWFKGMLWLILVDPTIFLALVIVTRIVLELILAIFALLAGMEQMTELLVRMTGTVEGVAADMPRVPFRRSWKLLRDSLQESNDRSSEKAPKRPGQTPANRNTEDSHQESEPRLKDT